MNDLRFPPSLIYPARVQIPTGPTSFGVLSTYPPAQCGLAAFSAALIGGLDTNGAQVGVVEVADGEPSSSPRVIGQLVRDSSASVAACSELLNQHDVAIISHGDGIYGGTGGSDVLDVLAGLRIPSIVLAHSIPKDPSAQQRSVLEAIGEAADHVVVMSESARRRLRSDYKIDARKFSTIPHGAAVPPKVSPSARFGWPTLLTWGLLRPGKGIERVIDAMGALRDVPGRPRYLIAGPTHPRVLAADGEAYREALIERAQRNGVADSVVFDANYRGVAALTALIQAAAVIVVPSDSTDQVTSGVLVDSIARGRPVVATAFPHAIEMLDSGAGIIVDHDDTDALAAALRGLLTQPRLAGAMAAEARRMAPALAWPVIGKAYLSLAHRLLTERKALV